jgi:hypothetical protein
MKNLTYNTLGLNSPTSPIISLKPMIYNCNLLVSQLGLILASNFGILLIDSVPSANVFLNNAQLTKILPYYSSVGS